MDPASVITLNVWLKLHNQQQLDDLVQDQQKPGSANYHSWKPASHWCAGCWHWVVDCEHLRDPLPLEHHAVDDEWIRSLAYDRVTQCLEVRFKWNSVHQYRPVPLQIVRKIWKARPMNIALQELVMKNRRIRFDEVRSEEKLMVSLLSGGWVMLQSGWCVSMKTRWAYSRGRDF